MVLTLSGCKLWWFIFCVLGFILLLPHGSRLFFCHAPSLIQLIAHQDLENK